MKDKRINAKRIKSNRETICWRSPVCNETGFFGVFLRKDKFRNKPFVSQLRHCGKRYFLGCYSSAVLAAHMYDQASRYLYGSDAVCNFPDIEIVPEPDYLNRLNRIFGIFINGGVFHAPIQ